MTEFAEEIDMFSMKDYISRQTLPNKHDCVQSKGNDSNVKEISPSALGPQRR